MRFDRVAFMKRLDYAYEVSDPQSKTVFDRGIILAAEGGISFRAMSGDGMEITVHVPALDGVGPERDLDAMFRLKKLRSVLRKSMKGDELDLSWERTSDDTRRVEFQSGKVVVAFDADENALPPYSGIEWDEAIEVGEDWVERVTDRIGWAVAGNEDRPALRCVHFSDHATYASDGYLLAYDTDEALRPREFVLKAEHVAVMRKVLAGDGPTTLRFAEHGASLRIERDGVTLDLALPMEIKPGQYDPRAIIPKHYEATAKLSTAELLKTLRMVDPRDVGSVKIAYVEDGRAGALHMSWKVKGSHEMDVQLDAVCKDASGGEAVGFGIWVSPILLESIIKSVVADEVTLLYGAEHRPLALEDAGDPTRTLILMPMHPPR